MARHFITNPTWIDISGQGLPLFTNMSRPGGHSPLWPALLRRKSTGRQQLGDRGIGAKLGEVVPWRAGEDITGIPLWDNMDDSFHDNDMIIWNHMAIFTMIPTWDIVLVIPMWGWR